MKKNKFLYMLSAFALACIISFSGVGGSYIQAKASSGITDVLWNDNATAWENISRHALLWANWAGAFIEPSLVGEMFAVGNSAEFAAYMITEGYTEEEAEECVHGGGGHVRDGISMDEDGNVTYSDEVSDLFHGFLDYYLSENSGYYVFKTTPFSAIPPSYFYSEERYNNFLQTMNSIGMCAVKFSCVFDTLTSSSAYTVLELPTSHFYIKSVHETDGFYIQSLNDNWVVSNTYSFRFGSNTYTNFQSPYSLSDLTQGNAMDGFYPILKKDNFAFLILSPNGCNVKLWKSLDAFKNYDVGRQMYYVTDSFNSYDSTIDNSVTMTNQEFNYYNDNSTNIYQIIQDDISENGTDGLTEDRVQEIVDNAVQEIKDSIADSGNDDGGGSDGGSGVGDLVDGIGKLLDTILSLIGKVMGVVADFTQSILDLFSGFTEFTDGFSNFLSGAFGFIPQEIWNVIQVGLSLMILLAVIKFLRK